MSEKGIAAAVVGGVFVVIGAVIYVVGPELLDDETASAAPSVTFDEVVPRKDHEGVSMSDGITARGSATNLPTGDSIWLMDKVAYRYAIAGEAVMSGDRWEAESYPLGDDPTRIPFTFRAVAIWADPSCANSLRDLINSSEPWRLNILPYGCREAATYEVTVTEE